MSHETKVAEFMKAVGNAFPPVLAEFGEKLRAVGDAANAGVAAAVESALERGRNARR